MAGAAKDDGVSIAAVDDQPTRPENTHRVVYLVAAAVFVGLAVWGLVAFNQHQDDLAAQDKATELSARFDAAGFGTLDTEATARVLGTDGGAACSDPGSALRDAVLHQQIVSGAAGPGQRPIIGTRQLVEAQRLVLEVYCPDELAGYDAHVRDLKLVEE